MPRQQEPMKDVLSCDKPRLAAIERLPLDLRMGQPSYLKNNCENGNRVN